VRGLALGYADGYGLEAHAHDWGQLLYASAGVMQVEAALGSWMVPPQRAVWLPPRVEHRVEMHGEVALRTLYFRGRSGPRIVGTRVVGITPLVRELVLHVVRLGKLDGAITPEARLARVLIDQLESVATMPLELPMPLDERALRVARRIRDAPAISMDVAALAREAAVSVRTLERLFQSETALSFGRWRQQARVLHALGSLGRGVPVNEVAAEVGYQSASAFIAMFKQALGITPGELLEG
jgi:AraC-like DNA-binding protein